VIDPLNRNDHLHLADRENPLFQSKIQNQQSSFINQSPYLNPFTRAPLTTNRVGQSPLRDAPIAWGKALYATSSPYPIALSTHPTILVASRKWSGAHSQLGSGWPAVTIPPMHGQKIYPSAVQLPHPADVAARKELAKMPPAPLERVLQQAAASRKFIVEWRAKGLPDLPPPPHLPFPG
jgi:hypothetical protein